jgi:hypothetical protein
MFRRIMRCFDLTASEMCARTAQMDSPWGECIAVSEPVPGRPGQKKQKGGGSAGCISADATSAPVTFLPDPSISITPATSPRLTPTSPPLLCPFSLTCCYKSARCHSRAFPQIPEAARHAAPNCDCMSWEPILTSPHRPDACALRRNA